MLVILPAFNESGSIATVVNELRQHLPYADILIVDDGSTDATLKRIPPGTPYVSLPFNLGIGGAMQTGYRYAAANGYDLAIQCDADGQHPPSEVAKLLDQMSKTHADMIIGSRFLPGSNYQQSASRMGGIVLLRSLIRLLSGRLITDCTSGFRVVNRKIILAFAHWYPDDYPEPEVVLLLLRQGYQVEEIPVIMHQRAAGQSSIPFVRGLFYVIKVSACLVMDMVRHPWPEGKVSPA
jgi:glycosyltransferase involved in cell wall biosynthesis